MVVLEAAAIGAAGYGLYRGGDAAVRKGKETHKEFQRERVRHNQKSELASKSNARKERIAQLASMREGSSSSDRPTLGFRNASSNTSAGSGGSSLSGRTWPSLGRGSQNDNTVASSSSSSIDERRDNVMAKLREGQAMEKKQQGPRAKLANLLKRK